MSPCPPIGGENFIPHAALSPRSAFLPAQKEAAMPGRTTAGGWRVQHQRLRRRGRA